MPGDGNAQDMSGVHENDTAFSQVDTEVILFPYRAIAHREDRTEKCETSTTEVACKIGVCTMSYFLAHSHAD